MSEMKKVHIFLDGDLQHFCYVDKEIYEEYKSRIASPDSITYSIVKWAKAEFGIVLSDRQSVYKLKKMIIAKYDATIGASVDLEPTPPNSDRYGWVRRWVHTKMLEEIV